MEPDDIAKLLTEDIRPERSLRPMNVIVRTKMIPETQWICPHCNEVIQEKGIYVEGFNTPQQQTYHRACGNPIIEPPPTEEQKQALEKFKQTWGKGII